MYLKLHKTEKGTILAACDAELIGKTLTDNGIELDLKKYADFYAGERTDENGIKKALDGNFDSINFVGKKVTSIVVKSGMVDQNDVMYIKNTPYIQIYSL